MFYTIVDGAGNVVAAGEGNAPPANALVLPGETAQSLIGYAQNNSAPNANDGTQWQAQIFNHLSANLIKVLGDGDVDLLPRTDDQLLTAFKNIIAANVEQITPASVIAGLTALRTETYRPGYRAGGDYVLGGGDADRGAYAGQQWQVINADNTLGDRYFWVNGAGATAADKRNAGFWRIMQGAVEIWRRGAAANGAGSAGQLNNIPATHRRYVGDGGAGDRQWKWADFRRVYFYFRENVGEASNNQASPISIPTADFVGGRLVSGGADAGVVISQNSVVYAAASAFRENQTYPNSPYVPTHRITGEF